VSSAGAARDFERGVQSTKGGPVTRARARAVREALAAATLADAGSAAGNMAGLPGGFEQLMIAYHDYIALDAALRGPFCRERAAFKPVLGVPPFAQGPGDFAVFNDIYEVIRKLNHMLLVGRFFGTQEELGTSCILNAFTGDAVEIARTAIEDAPASDATIYRLHSALRALLQAYLQPARPSIRKKQPIFSYPSV
jgi:hypothetical protein